MSRQNVIITVIVTIGIAAGILLGLYFYFNAGSAGSSLSNRSSGFFGFGGIGGSSGRTNSSNTGGGSDQQNSSSTQTVSSSSTIPELRHISFVPTAGSDFVIQNVYNTSSTSTKPRVVGTQESIRWMERGTGNIFDTSTSSLSVTRVSNTTITKIYEALFTNAGNSALIRGLLGNSDTIQTRFGTLQTPNATATEQILQLSDLPINISALALSPTKNQIFYILPVGTRGTIANTDGTSKISVFDSPFYEWLVSWPSAQGIVLNTKPSGIVNGFAYLLNPKTKAVSKIEGDLPGLTTLVSPDLKWALVGSSPTESMDLDLLTMKDKSTRNLSFKTLPEKCVWSKLNTNILYCAVPENVSFGTYPDIWYQGLVSFSDDLWKIDLATGQSTFLLRPSDFTGVPLDMTNLTLSSKEDYLTFIDKNDLSLWGFNITAALSTTTASSRNSSSTASSTTR